MKFTPDKYPSVGDESRKRDVNISTNLKVEPITDSGSYPYGIETDEVKIWFSSKNDRDAAIKDLKIAMKKAQNADFGIMDSIKDFLKQHRNIIMWLFLAAALDHFFLKGAFRTRIKGIIEGALNKLSPN